MHILTEKDSNTITINGLSFQGFISEDKCKVCGENIVYNEEYDAFLCAECNYWLDSQCGDSNCPHHCENRPLLPLTNSK